MIWPVDVDAAAKTLKFSVDNKAYGVAFNLPTGTKVSGAFSMYNARASVTCLHPKWRNKLQAICTTITLGVRSSSLMMTKKVSNDQTGAEAVFSNPNFQPDTNERPILYIYVFNITPAPFCVSSSDMPVDPTLVRTQLYLLL